MLNLLIVFLLLFDVNRVTTLNGKVWISHLIMFKLLDHRWQLDSKVKKFLAAQSPDQNYLYHYFY